VTTGTGVSPQALIHPSNRSVDMSNQQKAAQGSAAAAETTTSFSNMNAFQKIIHVSKVFVFFLTFGFAFPNILGD
jgi:hypothetical protein